MNRTKIEWTDSRWNPIRGCSRVSEGCRFCYAEEMANRLSGPGNFYEGLAKNGRWTGRVRLIEEKLPEPAGWKKPVRIFVNSMSDLFHENFSPGDVHRVLDTIEQTPRHTFQVLTKRPENAGRLLEGRVLPPNVWLGVSVENQDTAGRVPVLLGIPAAVRFVSYEPALGPVDWEPYGPIHWLIAGGESGRKKGVRCPDVEWFRAARDFCLKAGIPFFFKQWGTWNENGERVGKTKAGSLLDGVAWKQFPGEGRAA